jgi:hypothetical protein
MEDDDYGGSEARRIFMGELAVLIDKVQDGDESARPAMEDGPPPLLRGHGAGGADHRHRAVSAGDGLSRADLEGLGMLSAGPCRKSNANGFGCIGGVTAARLKRLGFATEDKSGVVHISDAGMAEFQSIVGTPQPDAHPRR